MPFGAMGLVLVPFLELREAPMRRGWGCEVSSSSWGAGLTLLGVQRAIPNLGQQEPRSHTCTRWVICHRKKQKNCG